MIHDRDSMSINSDHIDRNNTAETNDSTRRPLFENNTRNEFVNANSREYSSSMNSTTNSSNDNVNNEDATTTNNTNEEEDDFIIAYHSDYTIPTSNRIILGYSSANKNDIPRNEEHERHHHHQQPPPPPNNLDPTVWWSMNKHRGGNYCYDSCNNRTENTNNNSNNLTNTATLRPNNVKQDSSTTGDKMTLSTANDNTNHRRSIFNPNVQKRHLQFYNTTKGNENNINNVGSLWDNCTIGNDDTTTSSTANCNDNYSTYACYESHQNRSNTPSMNPPQHQQPFQQGNSNNSYYDSMEDGEDSRMGFNPITQNHSKNANINKKNRTNSTTMNQLQRSQWESDNNINNDSNIIQSDSRCSGAGTKSIPTASSTNHNNTNQPDNRSGYDNRNDNNDMVVRRIVSPTSASIPMTPTSNALLLPPPNSTSITTTATPESMVDPFFIPTEMSFYEKPDELPRITQQQEDDINSNAATTAQGVEAARRWSTEPKAATTTSISTSYYGMQSSSPPSSSLLRQNETPSSFLNNNNNQPHNDRHRRRSIGSKNTPSSRRLFSNNDSTNSTNDNMLHKQKSDHKRHRHRMKQSKSNRAVLHETVHAQSLILGIAFMAVWTSSNMMAPNLTNIAYDFNFDTTEQRDLYLGSYCAIATGILSIPIAAFIGISVDVFSNQINRKYIFVITCIMAGISSIVTGYCTSYRYLLLSRLINGGCSSGTIPIIFSLVSDLFDITERNAASSGLTAMMGVGVISGQIYAGMFGNDNRRQFNTIMINSNHYDTTVNSSNNITSSLFVSNYKNNDTNAIINEASMGLLRNATNDMPTTAITSAPIKFLSVVPNPKATSSNYVPSWFNIIKMFLFSSPTGWAHGFVISGWFTITCSFLCLWLVNEPVRGGKEHALIDMINTGGKYERKLTWSKFYHTMQHNSSNRILLWQGLVSTLPWGILYVFLNDYLSQERGFSVPDATYLVAIFGIGCALGGILGGYWGHIIQSKDRSYLPLFMSATTFLGIIPFIILLNTSFTNAHSVFAIVLAVSAGLISSLPSVSVRPCLLNVNPPETRSVALTGATLFINIGKGFGPCCVTLLVTIFQVDRKFAMNLALTSFWTIASVQFLFLSKTLPGDQDAMESELASYAAQQMIDAFRDDNVNSDFQSTLLLPEENRFIADANSSIVSIEERIASFDDIAAKETFVYVRDGILELPSPLFCRCGDEETLSSDGSRCSISSSSSGVGSHPAFMLGNDDDDSNKNVDESLSDDGDTLYDDGKELEGPHLLAGEMHSMEPTIRSPIAVIESSILQADHPSERTHLI